MLPALRSEAGGRVNGRLVLLPCTTGDEREARELREQLLPPVVADWFHARGCSSNRQRRRVSAEGFHLRRRLPLVVPQALDCLLLVPSDLASAKADELPIPVLLERTFGVPSHPKNGLWTELSRLGDFSGCGRNVHCSVGVPIPWTCLGWPSPTPPTSEQFARSADAGHELGAQRFGAGHGRP